MGEVRVWQFTNGSLQPKQLNWLDEHLLDDLLESMGYIKAGNLLEDSGYDLQLYVADEEIPRYVTDANFTGITSEIVFCDTYADLLGYLNITLPLFQATLDIRYKAARLKLMQDELGDHDQRERRR